MAESEKLCRLCAAKAETYIEIYDNEGCKLNLESKISKYLQIQVCQGDILPKSVCLDCCSKLDHCSMFHEASLQAQVTLQMIFPQTKMGSQQLEKLSEEIFQQVVSEETKPPEEQESMFQLMNLESDPPDYVECVLSDNRNAINIEKLSSTLNEVENTAALSKRKCPVPIRCPPDCDTTHDDDDDDEKDNLNDFDILDSGIKFEYSDVVNTDVTSKTEDETMPRKRREGWEKYPWMCTDCGQELPSMQALRVHHQSVHNQSPRYICAQCNKIYTKYYGFVSHVRRHKNYMKFCCEECGKCFSNKKVLESHRATHSDARPFVCSVCGKAFRQQSALYVHHRSHQPDSIKNKYPCNQCDKRFSTKPNLVTHMRIHTGIRNYTCDQCGKSFIQKGNLDAHLLTHSADKPHACPICNKGFKTPLQLRKHQTVHTGAKPHQCDVCGRQFRERGTLREHHRIHTGAMPFTCEFCGKSFRFKGILTTHRRQHTGERPYSCLECQHHFTNWPNYNKHMKRRHGINTSHQADPNKSAMHNICIPTQPVVQISPPIQNTLQVYEEDERDSEEGVHFYTQSTNMGVYLNNPMTQSMLGFYSIPQLQTLDPGSIDILHSVAHR